MTPLEQLRGYIAEPIPFGGSEGDTRFTDAELTAILEAQGGEVFPAAAEAWRMKAASLSHLVDVAEGSSRRQLSQRYDNAKEMMEYFSGLAATITVGVGRTRIREIVRP